MASVIYKKKKVFIDGSSGTTGLRIVDRLSARDDLSLVLLPEDMRHDTKARREMLNTCDVAFLCLPDDAAREAVAMVENPDVIVLDTSTAHRTNPAFAYGFPELGAEFAEKIRHSHRIAVPGCHASGFLALVHPLMAAGFLSPQAHLTCFSLTGYSGGGKKMIAAYQAENRDPLLAAPRQYGMGQTHKHLKEMQAFSGLETAPVFCPVVADFYSGMEVTVPLFASDLQKGSAQDIRTCYAAAYSSPIVAYEEGSSEEGFFCAARYAGKDCMKIAVEGNEERILLVARYDNLGKGASGAAIACMNMALGMEMAKGLVL